MVLDIIIVEGSVKYKHDLQEGENTERVEVPLCYRKTTNEGDEIIQVTKRYKGPVLVIREPSLFGVVPQFSIYISWDGSVVSFEEGAYRVVGLNEGEGVLELQMGEEDKIQFKRKFTGYLPSRNVIVTP